MYIHYHWTWTISGVYFAASAAAATVAASSAGAAAAFVVTWSAIDHIDH